MSAASTGVSLAIVTVPAERSMPTSVTPGRWPSSARTELAHPLQVIPSTLMVVVLMGVLSSGRVQRPHLHVYHTPLGYSTRFEGSATMMSTRSLRAAAAAGAAALVLLLTGCTDSNSTEDAGASATHDHGSLSQQ